MKYFLNTLFRVLTSVFSLLMVFLVLSGLYQQYFSGSRHTGFFGIGYAVVVSGSMEPALGVDDMIFYHAHDRADYEVGDIIVYTAERENREILITHRIVRMEEDHVITLGDANHGNEDDPVPVEKIIGKVVFRIPALGAAVSFFKTPLGLAAVTAAVVFLIGLNILLAVKWPEHKKVKTVSGEQRIRY